MYRLRAGIWAAGRCALAGAAVAADDLDTAVSATNVLDNHYAPCRAFGDCFTGNRRAVYGTAAYRF